MRVPAHSRSHSLLLGEASAHCTACLFDLPVKFTCNHRFADSLQGCDQVVCVAHFDSILALGDFDLLGTVAQGENQTPILAVPPPSSTTSIPISALLSTRSGRSNTHQVSPLCKRQPSERPPLATSCQSHRQIPTLYENPKPDLISKRISYP